MTTEGSKYPECDKIVAVHDQSQKLGEFLDWLREQGWELCAYQGVEDEESEETPDGWYPIHKPAEQLLAKFFGIDLNKVEAERRALLEAIREKQKNKE